MKRNEINKDLKHQGWKQLSIALDKEMPVKKKRSGIILFFILLTLFSTILIYGLKSYTSEKLSLNASKGNEMNSNIENKVILKNKIPSKTIDKRTKHDRELIKQKDNSENIKKQASTTINNDFAKTNKKYLNNAKTNKSSTSLSNSITKIVDFQGEKPIVKNRTNYLTSDIYNIKPSEILLNKDTKNLIVSITPKPINHKTYRLLNPFIGIEAFVFDYQNFNPKLNLKLGNRFLLNNRFFLNLDFGFIQNEVVFNNLHLALDARINYNNSNNLESQKYKLLFNKFKELKQITIATTSIGLGYNLTNKISIYLNGGFAYTKKVKTHLKNNQYGLLDLLNENNQKSYEQYYDNISDFTYFSDINLSYKPIKHLELSIGYKQFFEKKIKDSFPANSINKEYLNPLFFNHYNFFIGAKYFLF